MTTEEKNKIYDIADETVQKLIERFPEELKNRAQSIDCFLSDHTEHPGVYGCYTGNVYTGNAIVIYVDNIWNRCKKTGDDFINFVKCVYMHEFGHHFGLTELDLKDRCL
jgi:predicted Zn-dependent protease with MMP-like domain